MKRLDSVYEIAVEHTKDKVRGDMMHYLQDKEKLPAFEESEVERSHYVEQIWEKDSDNQASNQLPRAEKKQF